MVKPKMVLLQVVSASVPFALAILGWSGWTAFFAHRALVAMAAASVALLGIAMFSSGNVSAGEREDRGNRWVLIAFGLLTLLVAYLPAYTDRTGFWTLDGDTIRWVGVAIFTAGSGLRLWPVFVLGDRYSGLVAIQPGHTLVTTGVYGVIRNPSYAGLLVGLVGWALAFRSGLGLLLTAMMVPPLVARIRAEEKMLRSQFSSEYDAYCAHTWRLMPGVY
jgi:protein-S-isoprenylcysteine O-methyltransferase Ste14